jgi:hypothetical protein
MAKGPPYIHYTRMGDASHRLATTSQQALAWFKNAVQKLAGVTLNQEIEEEENKTQEQGIDDAIKKNLLKPVDHTNIGQMFLFKYDPKWKNRLDYWDVYPLVFPIGVFKGGFIGINLHYLPWGFRTGVIRHLSSFLNDSDKYDDEGRLEISYEILKSYNLMFTRFYKDCVRKYLYTQVRSQFQYVSPSDWDNVAVLPFERWEYKK